MFFTVKFPVKEIAHVNLEEVFGTIQEVLRGAGLSPVVVEPGRLLDWLRRMLNEDPSSNASHYDDRNIIRKQVLLATKIEKRFTSLKFDNRHFRCVTPKAFPLNGNPIQTNQLFGGIMGMATDSDQIRTPFFFTLNILLRNQKNKLHTKCNLVLQQQGVAASHLRWPARKTNTSGPWMSWSGEPSSTGSSRSCGFTAATSGW